jgi:hypothetical protein
MNFRAQAFLMLFVGLCCLGFGALATSVPGVAQEADDPDESLRLYAVHIDRVPKKGWSGYGIYLGRGLVLTVAHVVGSTFLLNPRVDIAGKDLSTTVLRKGSDKTIDLALLAIDESELPVSLRLRRLSTCKQPSWPGQPVVVVTPEGIARSTVIAPQRIPRNLLPKFRTAITDVATTGNSGSGVFDETKKCLLGIISAKLTRTLGRSKDGRVVRETHDIAKYFVPADEIDKFIPPRYQF